MFTTFSLYIEPTFIGYIDLLLDYIVLTFSLNCTFFEHLLKLL